MGQQTNIAWTDHTWNPWRGCTKVSPGCQHCYAEAMSKRNPSVLGIWGPQGTRVIASEVSWREPLKWDRQARLDGVRRRVFCASMADVFEDRPELVAPRVRLFHLISETRNLDWLLLTKRPENVLRFRGGDGVPRSWPETMPPNVWLGVSVESNDYRWRIEELLKIDAAVRFVSYEPALGPLDLVQRFEDGATRNYLDGQFRGLRCRGVDGHPDFVVDTTDAHLPRLHWLIAGGESGPGHRPCSVEWIADVARQCREAGVACFVKQDSGPRPGMQGRIPDALWSLKEMPR